MGHRPEAWLGVCLNRRVGNLVGNFSSLADRYATISARRSKFCGGGFLVSREPRADEWLFFGEQGHVLVGSFSGRNFGPNGCRLFTERA